MTQGKKIKQQLKLSKKKKVPSRVMVSTGSTQLDIQLSGKALGGIEPGRCVLMVGDSGAGKTWIGLSILAEASINPAFDDYLLIRDDPEDGALMKKARYFGRKLDERMLPPFGTKEEPQYSRYVEQLYKRLKQLQEQGKKFIYVIDSETALECRKEVKLRDKKEALEDQGKEVTGDFGMMKPRYHSDHLRGVVNRLRDTGSILVIISQTRKRIGPGAMYNPKTRAGGDALKFYAHLELWVSLKEKIKQTVRGKEVRIGIKVKARIEKNRQLGKEGTVEFPIYYSSGIDNTGSCVDYLVEWKHWKAKQGIINAKEFEVQLGREQLIRYIEDERMQKKLSLLVGKVFREVEEELHIKRRNRYADSE